MSSPEGNECLPWPCRVAPGRKNWGLSHLEIAPSKFQSLSSHTLGDTLFFSLLQAVFLTSPLTNLPTNSFSSAPDLVQPPALPGTDDFL